MDNMIEVIKNSIMDIDNLEKLIEKVWEYYVIGDFTNANKEINEIFDRLERLLVSLEKINSNLEKNINITSVLQIFKNIEIAMRNSDYVYVSDLILYELKPVAISWKEQILE